MVEAAAIEAASVIAIRETVYYHSSSREGRLIDNISSRTVNIESY